MDLKLIVKGLISQSLYFDMCISAFENIAQNLKMLLWGIEKNF